jgi:hypothetical protein
LPGLNDPCPSRPGHPFKQQSRLTH